MVRTQIQLSERQSEDLKRLARKQGISVAEIIRRSVNRTLKDGYVPSEDELWIRALRVVGCGHSGMSDVSERHDDYLVEAYQE